MTTQDTQSLGHPAAPRGEVPTAAPLQSPCALDHSELPVRPPEVLDALNLAYSFIRNGVEFGYIKDTTDPDWRGALKDIRAAITLLGGHPHD